MPINALSNLEDLGPEYKLSWPPEIFSAEVRSILNQEMVEDLWSIGAHLLEEAFEDDQVHRAFEKASQDAEVNFLTHMNARRYLVFLSNNAKELHERPDRSAYWLERNGLLPPNTDVEQASLQDDWVELIHELIVHGYFTKNAPFPDRVGGQPEDILNQKLDDLVKKRLGVRALWSLAHLKKLDEDHLYALVEVFHDLISRPRLRTTHENNDQLWDFSHQATTTGQKIYRWKVNALLAKHRAGLELSESYENGGRLVHVVSDPRSEIAPRIADMADPETKRTVEHSVALFERRNATRDDKRTACVALAGILEARRPLLKKELLKKDEGLLFDLANSFDLRHRNADQKKDYADEYLDWVFWIYLATVELTNRVTAKQEKNSQSSDVEYGKV